MKKKKSQGIWKRKKNTTWKDKATTKPDLDITQILELPYREFKITIINILRVPTEKLEKEWHQQRYGNSQKGSKGNAKI